MTIEDSGQDSWRAPYMSYATLANFLDTKISGGAVPPRIDTGFLDNYAGSVRPLLLATLKTIGMINDDGLVQESLREAVRSPDARKAVLRGWATQFYAEQIKLANQNATAAMLWETFAKHGFNGSTLRRGVIFYLGLSEDLELPKSAYFKAPKAPPSEARKRPGRGGRGEQDSSEGAQDHAVGEAATPRDDEATGTERRTIHLGSAGTVEVIVKVRWLDLPDDKFAKLRKLIKDIEALELAAQEDVYVDVDDLEDSP
jgi:hypothetical protein